MNIKLLVAAVLFAACNIANAANHSFNTLTGPAAHTFQPGAGSIIDTVNFTITNPSNLGSVASPTNLSFGALSIYNITDLAYSITGPGSFSANGFLGNNTSYNTVLNNIGEYTIAFTGKADGGNGGLYTVALNVAAVPEPETYALMMAGLALVGFAARRKQQA